MATLLEQRADLPGPLSRIDYATELKRLRAWLIRLGKRRNAGRNSSRNHGEAPPGTRWPSTRRAAMIYQHEARGADKAITDAIDTHVQGEQGQTGGVTDTLGSVGYGPLMAPTQHPTNGSCKRKAQIRKTASELGLCGAGDGNRTRTVSLGS